MSNFIDEFKLLLKNFDGRTAEFATGMIESEKPDFSPSKPFLRLRGDEAFIKRFARLYGAGVSEAHRKKIIEVLIGLSSVESIGEVLNLYSSGDAFTRDAVKKALTKSGYGLIDHFSRLRHAYKSTPEVLSLMDSVVRNSGYYDDLKDLLESPTEKIILYVLKQYHKYCDGGVIEILKKFCRDQNWMVRFNTLQVLKKLEKPEALDLMLAFMADDNIKVREEAKTFIISNYALFSDKITGFIDEPYKISDLGFFQGVLEIFEYHPDFTRIFKLIKIMTEFPEGVSLKARTVLFSVLKTKLKTRELALDRDCERYKLVSLVFSELCRWSSEHSARLIGKMIETFGYVYVDILCEQYFRAENEDAKNLITRLFREHQYFLKERSALLEICHTLDREGLERFIKLLAANKVRDVIPAFAKIVEELGHKRTVELYGILTENDFNARGFGFKYKEAGGKWNAEAQMESIEALARLKDPELPEIVRANWKNYSRRVKDFALETLETGHIGQDATALLNYIFISDDDHELKARALNILSKIDSTESTEIILKAFASPKKDIAEIASRILVEKGRERLLSQISVLPDKLKEELGSILIKNDGRFMDEIERQIASTDPKVRGQIIKLLTHLSRNDRTKVLNLLKKFLKNPDPHIRAEFTKLMEIIGGREIIEYVLPLINDDNARVKANAIEVIASLGIREISNILLPLTSHANNRVRANAIIALYKLGNPNVIVGLSEMLRSPDKWMRASATYALGEISDPRVLPLLYTVLNDGDPDVIKNAFKVIKKIGDAESVKHLTKFLNHDNKAVKTAASEAINHLRKELMSRD